MEQHGCARRFGIIGDEIQRKDAKARSRKEKSGLASLRLCAFALKTMSWKLKIVVRPGGSSAGRGIELHTEVEIVGVDN